MRAFGRDLIRGGHYGQRSCEPHLKAEHMAAPTNAAYVKKALANSELSTHGTKRTSQPSRLMSASGGIVLQNSFSRGSAVSLANPFPALPVGESGETRLR